MGRVLILEDRPEIQAILRAVVVRTGHNPALAGDVPQARAQMDPEPSMVFVDISLPGEYSGIDFIRELRGSSQHRDIPVVIVTGNPEKVKDLEADGIHGIPVVLKPFRFAHITAIIEKTLGGGAK